MTLLSLRIANLASNLEAPPVYSRILAHFVHSEVEASNSPDPSGAWDMTLSSLRFARFSVRTAVLIRLDCVELKKLFLPLVESVFQWRRKGFNLFYVRVLVFQGARIVDIVE